MIPQNRSTKFIQSINYRKKFISQMIGLEAIQKKFEKAKHIFRKKNILLEDLIEKNFKDKFAVVINNISGFTEKIKRLTNIKNEVTDNIKQLKKDIKNKQKKIKNFDEEIVNIEDLEKNKSKLNENINNNTDKLINLNNNINENKKLLEQLKNKIQKFDYSLFENIENRFDKARKEYNYTNREIEKTKYIITDILKKIKILDEQP
jgi:tRNA A58 N-methylase Trm61